MDQYACKACGKIIGEGQTPHPNYVTQHVGRRSVSYQNGVLCDDCFNVRQTAIDSAKSSEQKVGVLKQWWFYFYGVLVLAMAVIFTLALTGVLSLGDADSQLGMQILLGFGLAVFAASFLVAIIRKDSEDAEEGFGYAMKIIFLPLVILWVILKWFLKSLWFILKIVLIIVSLGRLRDWLD